MAKAFDIKAALGGLAQRMKKDKRVEIAVYAVLALLGVLLFIATSPSGSGDSAVADVKESSEDIGEAARLESKLEETLSSMRGAGIVRVMITYDTGSKLVPAMSTDTHSDVTQSAGGESQSITENRTESSRPATISGSGGTETIVLTEIEPTVRGVIVIAEGAADVAVRLRLQNAVMTVLGISADKIEVFEMKSASGEEAE